MNAHSPSFGRSPASIPAPAKAKPALELADVRLTPGAYMRHCRARAGLTVHAVAGKITSNSTDRQFAYRDIHRMERDEPGDYGYLVTCLHDSGAFRFDLAKLAALAAETCDVALDPDAEV